MRAHACYRVRVTAAAPPTRKHECILAEAARAFARFGLKKTSIDAIATAAGVGKGTVYLVASSKEALYVEVLGREIRAWTDDCTALVDEAERAPHGSVDAAELLVRLLERALAGLEHRPLVRALLLGDADRELAGWDGPLAGLRAAGRANVERVLRLGQATGRFRAGLDVPRVATLLQDVEVSQLLLYPAEGPGTEAFAARAATALDLVMHGLCTPNSAEK